MSLLGLFAYENSIKVPEKLHILKESEVEDFNYQQIIEAVKKDIVQLVEQINLQIRSKVSYKWIRLSKNDERLLNVDLSEGNFNHPKDTTILSLMKESGWELKLEEGSKSDYGRLWLISPLKNSDSGSDME